MSASEGAQRLYVIRHGQTQLNVDGRLRGLIDEPLDDAGHRQACALAELFASVPLARLVTSPLRRAWETAEPIARATAATLEIDDAFVDRNWGPWAGKPRGDVEIEFGTLDRAPGVEPAGAVASRVIIAARDLVNRAGDDAVAIVAHDAVNRALLARLADNTPAEAESIPQRCGCWNRIERHNRRFLAMVIDALPGDGQEP